MKWIKSLFQNTDPDESDYNEILSELRERFASFLLLLEKNNRIHKLISDLEEKAQGGQSFDMRYVSSIMRVIFTDVEKMIEQMILIGGGDYFPLRKKFLTLWNEITLMLPTGQSVTEGSYVYPIQQIDHRLLFSVGSKAAQMGEMRGQLGLNVPDGFAISTWAYTCYINSNDLRERINKRIKPLDIRIYQDLVRVSHEIQGIILKSDLPDEIENEILRCYHELVKRSGKKRVAMRSSAIGEDTQTSFAGQYESFLNISGDEEVLEKYKAVIASKFTPKAIYYMISHTLKGGDHGEYEMGVCCVNMVDAVASGVVYTCDPLDPEKDSIHVHSIYGLGKSLVDGSVSPDIFVVSRENGKVEKSVIADKKCKLVVAEDGGVVLEEVEEEKRRIPSIGNDVLRTLVDWSYIVEYHYGSPQDIEWALGKNGKLYLLQTRPLIVLNPGNYSTADIDTDDCNTICKNGSTICPGACSGKVFHVSSPDDFPHVPEGAVIVASHPFPGLVTMMERVSAIVTSIGGIASHMATLAREKKIPTISDLEDTDKLVNGMLVTVDATGGAIYEGKIEKILETRKAKKIDFDDSQAYFLLKKILAKITPLKLVTPEDKSLFTINSCSSLHDITRFCHQKSIEEIFRWMTSLKDIPGNAYRLKTNIPLDVYIILLDGDSPSEINEDEIAENKIPSVPMQRFWDGILEEGWPKREMPKRTKEFPAIFSTISPDSDRTSFAESSYAFLSKNYMLVSLRLGYHFTTVEALCTEEPGKNYIRFEHKGGGASLERRIRRVKLIESVLAAIGFVSTGKRDFLETMLQYQSSEITEERLKLVGRLTILTKQLDMALSNDRVAEWYTNDLKKKLGILQG